MPSLIEELEKLGGGVFFTHKGNACKLSEAEMWLAFEEPVMVWVRGEAFKNCDINRLVEIAKQFPHIQGFRFTGTSITEKSFLTLRQHWPNVPIEY